MNSFQLFMKEASECVQKSMKECSSLRKDMFAEQKRPRIGRTAVLTQEAGTQREQLEQLDFVGQSKVFQWLDHKYCPKVQFQPEPGDQEGKWSTQECGTTGAIAVATPMTAAGVSHAYGGAAGAFSRRTITAVIWWMSTVEGQLEITGVLCSGRWTHLSACSSKGRRSGKNGGASVSTSAWKRTT